MDLLHIIVLALIQGLTEFLPISSSAHLLLPKELLGWPDQGLAFDVAVHVGTLLAVMLYFRRDVADMVGGGFALLRGQLTDSGRLVLFLVAGTLPVGIAGVVMEPLIVAHLRSAQVIAWTTLGGALLLWWAARTNQPLRELGQMTLWLALVIGASQALALVPGTSRSGITITVALLLGFTPHSAARFSFLLSMPVIFLSGAWQSIELLSAPTYPWRELLLGAVLSGVTAYLSIHFFLTLLARVGMMPFVLYRLALGLGLLLLF